MADAAGEPRNPITEATATDGDLCTGIAEIKRMYGTQARVVRVRLDTHDRLHKANALYRPAGYRQIPEYSSNPRANRWFEKLLA